MGVEKDRGQTPSDVRRMWEIATRRTADEPPRLTPPQERPKAA